MNLSSRLPRWLPAALATLALLVPAAVVAADTAPAKAPPLSAYVGHYPYEKVNGVDFLHHPLVIKAVNTTVPDPGIRRLLLSADYPMTPLKASRGRLLMPAYDPASAGSVNWALVIALDGSKAAVCYAAGEPVQDVSGARWFYRGEEGFVLYLPCPHYPDELEKQTGNWPIGPMVN